MNIYGKFLTQRDYKFGCDILHYLRLADFQADFQADF